MAGLTEITSNVATANILLPVLAEVVEFFFNPVLHVCKSIFSIFKTITNDKSFLFSFKGSSSNVNKPTLPDDPCNCEWHVSVLTFGRGGGDP